MNPLKSKILLVTRNFPPLMGGMERLLFHIYEELSKAFDVAIVGPVGCQDYLKPHIPVSVCPPLPPWKFLLHCQVNTLRMAKRFAPDLIFAGSGVTAPAAAMSGRLLGIPVVSYLHGLDIVANSPAYQSIFLPAIRLSYGIIVNSHHTGRLARATKIKSHADVLHPGVTIPAQKRLVNGKRFRERIKAGTRPILLSVGRLTQRKGIVEFIDRCLPKIVKAFPGLLYVIIGNEPKNAIGGERGMIDRILDTSDKWSLREHILLMTDVDDLTLGQAYSASQLHVFPVIHQPHDIEGFGMVAVEAAAHGLPTVAFATGGVVDAVKHGVSGCLIPAGDYHGLTESIIDQMKSPNSMVSNESCIEFAEGFSWKVFGARLTAICWETIGRSGVSSMA